MATDERPASRHATVSSHSTTVMFRGCSRLHHATAQSPLYQLKVRHDW